MALVGYARVSSVTQNLARQLERLEEAGVTKMFNEQMSGSAIEGRDQLAAMLDWIRDGDTVVVTEVDRLSRNYDDVKNIIQAIKDKGANFRSLDLPDFTEMPSPFDQMMMDMMIYLYAGIAQNERDKIRERQAQGIAIAKRKGKYKGGVTMYAADSPDPQKRIVYKNIVMMLNDGEPIKKIADDTGVSRPLIYKIKKQLAEQAG